MKFLFYDDWTVKGTVIDRNAPFSCKMLNILGFLLQKFDDAKKR